MTEERPKLIIDFDSSKPLGEVVYDAIREAIVKNQFRPGERLMETELADEMAVSRTPVREAVRRLESEGYVEMIPRKGTYVSALSIQDVNDVFEIRAALEALAAYNAAIRATDEDIRDMKHSMEAEASLWESSDLVKTIEVDLLFHSQLYRSSKNKRIETLVNDLREQTYRLRSATLATPGRLKFALDEHRNILQAIEDRDPKAARKAAYAHIEQSRDVMLGLLRYQA